MHSTVPTLAPSQLPCGVTCASIMSRMPISMMMPSSSGRLLTCSLVIVRGGGVMPLGYHSTARTWHPKYANHKLKAAITKACWDDPQVQQAYRECAEHYGFLIAPCRPRTPEHKGKVEQGGVHYVKRNFLGGRVPTTITQANLDVRSWCLTTAGLRCHGTTKAAPLERFQAH